MKRFFEIIILLVLAAALGTGIYNLCKSNDKPKEETPAVETLKLDIYDSEKVNILYTIEYEEGMTWGEWLESDYNSEEFYVYESSYAGGTMTDYIICVDDHSVRIDTLGAVELENVIDNSNVHILSTEAAYPKA